MSRYKITDTIIFKMNLISLSDFKNGSFQQEYKKGKLTVGDSALVFTKDLEISFWTIWTLDGFGLRRMQWVRINQLSETKLLLHHILNKSKTSWYFNYGFYWHYRKVLIHQWVLLPVLVLLLVYSTYLKSGTCTMVHVTGILQFALRNDLRK